MNVVILFSEEWLPNITVMFKRNFKSFPHYNIHALRHSYASYLANNGVDIFVLQSLMRHAQITETMGTYSHLYTQKTRCNSHFDK